MPLSERGRQPILLKIGQPGASIPPRNKNKEIALRFVNRLIDVVRYVTEEYHLEHVRYPDILSYRQYYWDGKKGSQPVLFLSIQAPVELGLDIFHN